MSTPILPGATIGIFGSGQLGRMMTFAAKRMGYRVHTFSPESDSPSGQVADQEIVGTYDDVDAVQAFLRNIDVATFEFENINAMVAFIASEMGVPVHPGGWVLKTAQNRILEKTTLSQIGAPVPAFSPIRCEQDLEQAAVDLGFPIVLKTASSGYDGKGQRTAANAGELRRAWDEINRQEAVAEEYVQFVKEVSVIGARSTSGEYADFGVIENVHSAHILDYSLAPATVSHTVVESAREIAKRIFESLDVVGVLCIEMFVVGSNDNEDAGGELSLLVNEIAPRPHNSGHLTIEAAVTSQFEQHVRAICGLPLGSTAIKEPAAMVNLLGHLWSEHTPDWSSAIGDSDVKLHLYGKHESRPGRKMGHLTVVAESQQLALQKAMAAREALA